MAASKNTAFAESAVTVHVKLTSEPSPLPDGTVVWDVESRILKRGETLPFSVMPDYQVDLIKKGKVPGLHSMTEAQAKKAAEFYQSGREGAMFINSEEQVSDPDFPAEEF